VLRVSDCITDRVRFAIPQPTEWQHIADQINAEMIFARSDFVNVFDLTHLRGLRGKRFTSTANSTARNRVWRVNAVHANLRFNPRKKGIHTISQEPPAVARRIAGESVPQLSQKNGATIMDTSTAMPIASSVRFIPVRYSITLRRAP
jgi:hypothetical protein